MNRRNWIAGTLAAVVAGPKAVAALLEQAKPTPYTPYSYIGNGSGLLDMVTSTSVHSLNGSTYDGWQGWVVDLSSEPPQTMGKVKAIDRKRREITIEYT